MVLIEKSLQCIVQDHLLLAEDEGVETLLVRLDGELLHGQLVHSVDRLLELE